MKLYKGAPDAFKAYNKGLHKIGDKIGLTALHGDKEPLIMEFVMDDGVLCLGAGEVQ